jgi:hypothetical protein
LLTDFSAATAYPYVFNPTNMGLMATSRSDSLPSDEARQVKARLAALEAEVTGLKVLIEAMRREMVGRLGFGHPWSTSSGPPSLPPHESEVEVIDEVMAAGGFASGSSGVEGTPASAPSVSDLLAAATLGRESGDGDGDTEIDYPTGISPDPPGPSISPVPLEAVILPQFLKPESRGAP